MVFHRCMTVCTAVHRLNRVSYGICHSCENTLIPVPITLQSNYTLLEHIESRNPENIGFVVESAMLTGLQVEISSSPTSVLAAAMLDFQL